MANRKNCVKCGRNIDEFARVCPYCNWEQSQPVLTQRSAPEPAPAQRLDTRARYSILGILTFGFLMMVAFTIGSLAHGARAANAAQPQAAAPQESSSTPAAKVTLVPITDGAPPPTAPEAPVTAIAPTGTTPHGGPADATALPSEQYAAAAARAQAPQKPAPSMIDPRSITGSPYAEPPQRRAAARTQSAERVVETQPIPVFQPVPHVYVDHPQTAQLALLVGTDGRVHDVDVQREVPGVMGPLMGSVQQWRFRPAMQNGEPVSSRFTVAVTFRP